MGVECKMERQQMQRGTKGGERGPGGKEMENSCKKRMLSGGESRQLK